MEYLIVFVMQLLGVGFHVGQKIVSLGNAYPEKSRSEIVRVFFKEDWDTLFISALVLLLDEMIHIIINGYATHLTVNPNFYLYSFGAALVLGYAGQRLVYKFFGSAEKFLGNQIDNKLQ